MGSQLFSINASSASGLSGLLSSLGALLEGSSANEGVFSQFLQQNQDVLQAPRLNSQQVKQSSTANTSASSNATANTASSDTADDTTQNKISLPVLKKILVGIHHIVEQLKQQGKAIIVQKKDQSDNAPSVVAVNQPSIPHQLTSDNPGFCATAGAATDASTSVSADASMAAVTAATSASTDTSITPASNDVTGVDSSTGASGDTPSLTDVLSQLVALMQMIEKNLEMADATAKSMASSSVDAGASASSSPQSLVSGVNGDTPFILSQADIVATASQETDPSMTADAPTEPSIAADSTPNNTTDPLTKLLALIQSIEKKITDPSNDNAQSSQTSSSTTADPNVPMDPATTNLAAALNLVTKTDLPQIQLPDFSDVEKKIQTLLVSLRSALAVGGTSGANGAPTATDTNTSNSVAANIPAAQSDLAKNDKGTFAPLADLSNLFSSKANNVFSNPSTSDFNAAVSGNPNFMPQSGDGGKDDLLGGNDRGGARTAMNMQNVPSDNSALTALSDGAGSTNPYTFASQLSAARAANGGTTGLPSVAEQVLLQLNRGVKDGNDQMTIQLHPADLGKISIKLDIGSDGKVQGTVVADNPATLNTLLKDVRGLERALQEAGLRADSGSLQFSLGGQGNTSGQMPNNSGSGSSNNNSSFDTSMSVADVAADADESWYLTPGRVNFKV